jgi:hypothetical protein
MRIRMTTQLIWRGREIAPGESVELPDGDARRFVASGQAEFIQETKSPVIESANLDRSQHSAMRDTRPPQAKRR